MAGTGKRLLLMRLGAMGDIVLTTPTVRALRRAFPDATIAFLTSAPFAPFYTSNPYVDVVLTTDRRRSSRSPSEMFRIIRELRKWEFDIALDMHRKFKTAFFAFAAGIPQRIGATFLDTHRVALDPTVHATQRHLSALHPLGIRTDDTRLEVFLSKEDEETALQRMLEQRIYPGLRPILGIFPGASWRPKAWMPDRFAEIARRAIGEWNAQIALVGGSRESDLIERIVAQVDAPIGVFRELPLGVLGGVLRHCDRFLSSDSGPMHLAVGVGTPTVALFGPSQFGRFAPEHAPHVGVRVPMPCSPCKERGDHCRNNACMRLITIDHVWTTLERLEPSNARTTKPM